jgi:ATP-dependent DNA helicase RecG
LPALRFGDLRQHLELLTRARELAAEVVDRDPELELPEHAALRAALERIAGGGDIYDAESG